MTDNGKTAGQLDAKSITESMRITVYGTNDAPFIQEGVLRDLQIREDDGLTSLGFESIFYSPGSGRDEQDQRLSFTIIEVPESKLGRILLSNGGVVLPGQVYTQEEFNGMGFEPNPDEWGSGIFRWSVNDDGKTLGNNDPKYTFDQITINVASVNDAPSVSAGAIHDLIVKAGTTMNLGLDTINFIPGPTDELGQRIVIRVTKVPDPSLGMLFFNPGSGVAVGQVLRVEDLRRLQFEALSGAVDLSGQFEFSVTDNGANGRDRSSALFSINITVQPIVEFNSIGEILEADQQIELLKLLASGLTQDQAEAMLAASKVSTKDSNSVKFEDFNEVDIDAYSSLDPEDPNYIENLSGEIKINGKAANYSESGDPYVFNFEIGKDEQGRYIDEDSSRAGVQVTAYLSFIDGQEDWPPEKQGYDPEQYDKYLKFIPQYTIDEYNKIGIILYDLDGNPVTEPGWYDFTQRDGVGDGAEYVYNEAGRVIGVNVHFTDNQFGDNNPEVGYVKDPGSNVNILPELGQDTYVTNVTNVFLSPTVNSTSLLIPNFFKSNVAPPDFKLGDAPLNLNTSQNIGPGNYSESTHGSGTNDALLAQTGGGGDVAAMSLNQPTGGSDESSAGQNGDGGGKGQSKQVGLASGAGNGLGEDQSPKTQRKRGLMLQPIIEQLSSSANDVKSSSNLLKNLSEGTVMGNNLLDALALGAGVLYALYAPKAVETGKKGFRGLVNRLRQRGSTTPVLAEQNLLSIFVMKLPNGTERLMAARVGMGGMEVIAQQDLPADVRVDSSGSQTQVDFAMKQLIGKLGSPNADLLLLGPTLRGQAALLQSLAKQSQLLNIQDLSSNLSTCSATELEALQNWLNRPSSTPPESSPVYKQMLQRIDGYATQLPVEQANMAALLELSVALGYSQNQRAS